MTDYRENLGAHRRSTPCEFCGTEGRQRHDRTCPKAKRAKAARERGNRRELYVQRTYGPTKVGHFGGAIDNIGSTFKWQSKTMQLHPPLCEPRCAYCEVPVWVDELSAFGIVGRKPAKWFTDPMDHMNGLRDDLSPLLIKSWTRRGVGSTDVIVVRADDWVIWHDLPAYEPGGWDFYAMTGSYFLDVHGRDEE